MLEVMIAVGKGNVISRYNIALDIAQWRDKIHVANAADGNKIYLGIEKDYDRRKR